LRDSFVLILASVNPSFSGIGGATKIDEMDGRALIFPDDDSTLAQRQRMVEAQLRARGIKDARALDAMLRVPRHLFVDESNRGEAYEDHPLPIGEEQTISQPYIVALMLEILRLAPTDRALEVGTGSGYATALLAELVARVVSVERHKVLADQARERLIRLGYANVNVIAGDGAQGYSDSAPYDAILVSAASAAVPPALLFQLSPTGRLVIPVGPMESQQLQLIEMRDGHPQLSPAGLCRFVPLIEGIAT